MFNPVSPIIQSITVGAVAIASTLFNAKLSADAVQLADGSTSCNSLEAITYAI